MMRRMQLLLGAVVFGALVIGNGLWAETTEETTTTTTTSTTGVVDGLTSGALIVKSPSDPTPLSYTYSKTTTYVDEDGNPVAVETLKSGAPVTIYYSKSADGLVASKVVVKKHVDPATGATTIEEKRTTVKPQE
jgi:hypothetical protein